MNPSGGAGSVGHDLNNILGKIIAAAEIAQDHVTDAQALLQLERVLDLAEEAAALVSSLDGRRG